MNIEKLKSYLKSKINAELDDILDQRDGQAFDSAWCQVYEVVYDVSSGFDSEALFIELSDLVSQHEIVSYIIDDLIMLDKAKEVGVSPPFVLFMRESYEKGVVPHVWQS
ncbi:hypothetical protein MO867_15975 [Microbulbifer sp. OS29]|uniref:Uncharacterized protein n=1 Tax=Microbulbifer okhotskensis TaxID=2926617 RepID=A0A9X2J627_9GAMM|nr:hypothetical protein [Microbulbifer okhotskensis]MCO1335833.1 hypothetical protein [Microbulbifer okhotskensis]